MPTRKFFCECSQLKASNFASNQDIGYSLKIQLVLPRKTLKYLRPVIMNVDGGWLWAGRMTDVERASNRSSRRRRRRWSGVGSAERPTVRRWLFHRQQHPPFQGNWTTVVSKMLMDAVESRKEMRREEGILSRLQEEENKEKSSKERIKEEENEAAEFNRLHSLLPFLGSKSVTELDIVLEAITYIHLLQARLQGGPQRQWGRSNLRWKPSSLLFRFPQPTQQLCPHNPEPYRSFFTTSPIFLNSATISSKDSGLTVIRPTRYVFSIILYFPKSILWKIHNIPDDHADYNYANPISNSSMDYSHHTREKQSKLWKTYRINISGLRGVPMRIMVDFWSRY